MADVEITVDLVSRTDGAFLIKNLKDGNSWVPRSQVSDYVGEEDSPETIFIPEWLAEEKYLI